MLGGTQISLLTMHAPLFYYSMAPCRISMVYTRCVSVSLDSQAQRQAPFVQCLIGKAGGTYSADSQAICLDPPENHA